MATPTILQVETNPSLFKPAQPIDAAWFNGNQLKQLIKNMSQALAKEVDGVALAAPQIGESYRLFIVSHKVLDRQLDLVFINPQIIKHSKQQEWLDEGCLSVRHWYGQVRRYTKATVSAYSPAGRKFEFSGSGLIAQIFQHEIDHLDGLIFADKARNLHYVDPQST